MCDWVEEEVFFFSSEWNSSFSQRWTTTTSVEWVRRRREKIANSQFLIAHVREQNDERERERESVLLSHARRRWIRRGKIGFWNHKESFTQQKRTDSRGRNNVLSQSLLSRLSADQTHILLDSVSGNFTFHFTRAQLEVSQSYSISASAFIQMNSLAHSDNELHLSQFHKQLITSSSWPSHHLSSPHTIPFLSSFFRNFAYSVFQLIMEWTKLHSLKSKTERTKHPEQRIERQMSASKHQRIRQCCVSIFQHFHSFHSLSLFNLSQLFWVSTSLASVEIWFWQLHIHTAQTGCLYKFYNIYSLLSTHTRNIMPNFNRDVVLRFHSPARSSVCCFLLLLIFFFSFPPALTLLHSSEPSTYNYCRCVRTTWFHSYEYWPSRSL